MQNILTQAELRDILSYDKETGIFRWRKKTSKFSHMKVGDIAGTADHHRGYVYIKINNKQYAAHRLAWLYVYGEFPPKQIDHINRQRSDNRIDNLRSVDNAANALNRNVRVDCKTGVTGVMFDSKSQKWRSYFRNKHLGFHNTLEDAIAARIAAEPELIDE